MISIFVWGINMRFLTSFFVASLVATLSGFSTASAEDCLMPNSNPFAQTNSTYGWFFDYQNSIIFSESLRYTNVAPQDAQWKRLEVMGHNPPIQIDNRYQQIGTVGNLTWQHDPTHIEQPIFVATWASPLEASDGYESKLSRLNGNGSTFGFITKSNQLNSTGHNWNCTIWFSKDGQTGEFLDDLFQAQNFDMDRTCLNMSPMKNYYDNLESCQQSILWGLPSAGVPYGFGWTSHPYDPNGLPWWNTNIYIGVVDRRAMIRPSYNPTVKPMDGMTPLTYDGLPQWDSSTQSYALPMGNPWGAGMYSQYTRAVWDAICPGLDCRGDFGFLAWDGTKKPYGSPLLRKAWKAPEFSLEELLDDDGNPIIPDLDLPIEVFDKWLTEYQKDNWVSDSPPWSSYTGFPFASIGLTVNWIDTSVNDPFGVSEFILKGRAPITWVAKRSAAQYLGTREPGQVSWCDSCLGDLDMNGHVDVGDLLMVLQAWGNPQPCMTFEYPSFNDVQDGMAAGIFPEMQDIGTDSILALIEHWGPCKPWPIGMRPPSCQ